MKRTFSLIVVVCWVFAACQPTPEKLIVQNKADGELMDDVAGQTEATDDGSGKATAENTQGEYLQKSAAEYMAVDHVTFSEELANGFKADADVNVFDMEQGY